MDARRTRSDMLKPPPTFLSTQATKSGFLCALLILLILMCRLMFTTTSRTAAQDSSTASSTDRVVILTLTSQRHGPQMIPHHQQDSLPLPSSSERDHSSEDGPKSTNAPRKNVEGNPAVESTQSPAAHGTMSAQEPQTTPLYNSFPHVAGNYKDPSWSRQATIEDSEGSITPDLSDEERRHSILEVEMDVAKMRARGKEFWSQKRLSNPAAPFKKCLGTRNWMLYGDSHQGYLFNHLPSLKLGDPIRKYTLGPYSNKSPPTGGIIATLPSKFLDATYKPKYGPITVSEKFQPDIMSIFQPPTKYKSGYAHVQLEYLTHLTIGTGAVHAVTNNTHPYDLYWRIRTFVKDIRAKLKNVVLIGYIPHFYQQAKSFRTTFSPCVAEWRILALREASIAAYIAEKVDWIVDAWRVTKAHPDIADTWGHHYYEPVTMMIHQDILNTIFGCSSHDADEILANQTGKGLPGDGGQIFSGGPKVTRIFKPNQVRVKDRFVKPGTNPEDGIEDRDSAEGARVPWPEMRVCECNRNPFYEICEVMQPFAGLGAKWLGKSAEKRVTRWRVARRYCELGKKQLESTGTLPVQPLDQTRTIVNVTFRPDAKPLPADAAVAGEPYSPFPDETLLNTTKYLTTADHWDHFLALACDASPIEFRNCAVNVGGDLFKLVNNWESSDAKQCANLLSPVGLGGKFRVPSYRCPSVKRGCANNVGQPKK